jgi:hypothetical protein
MIADRDQIDHALLVEDHRVGKDRPGTHDHHHRHRRDRRLDDAGGDGMIGDLACRNRAWPAPGLRPSSPEMLDDHRFQRRRIDIADRDHHRPFGRYQRSWNACTASGVAAFSVSVVPIGSRSPAAGRRTSGRASHPASAPAGRAARAARPAPPAARRSAPAGVQRRARHHAGEDLEAFVQPAVSVAGQIELVDGAGEGGRALLSEPKVTPSRCQIRFDSPSGT